MTGTTTVDAIDGDAAFTDPSLDHAGVGCTMTASAAGLTCVTGAAFEIVALGPGQIAFVSMRDGNQDIYVMNADGSGQVNLTNNPANDGIIIVPGGLLSDSPVWSPDGSKIAFESDRDGRNFLIYVMNADGSGQVNSSTTRYTAAPRGRLTGPRSPSPSSKFVAGATRLAGSS